MALDRKLKSSAAATKRRPAAPVTAQRGDAETARQPARALQEHLGNRAAQAFVARSVSGTAEERIAPAAAPPIVRQTLHSPGEPLDAAARTQMEDRFGHDFGGVRVHTDPLAAASSLAVGARAYTVGSDVVFGPGQYAPKSARGRELLAHELTHAIEQQTAGVSLQRAPLDKEVETELAEWAAKNKKTTDPKNERYAFDLQEFAWTLIGDPADVSAPLPKPKGKKDIAEWEKRFKKAEILAKKILAADPRVLQRESRAAMILQYLALAGFTREAVDLSKMITDPSELELIYRYVLQTLDKSTPAKSLTVLTETLIAKQGASNEVIQKLTDKNDDFEKRLSKEQLTAILTPIIAKYENDAMIVDLLSEVLIYRADYRETFSTWMWKEKKEELLFRVLEGKYFVEPDYGGSAFPNVPALALEKDMPWVYEQKQRYYVGWLVQIGKDTGVDIKTPKPMKIETLRAWLDDNTEKIGEAVAKKFPTDPDQWRTVYERLADIFFYHVWGRNIQPDLHGKLAKLKPAAPKKMRLEADCDVLATYAMRFFFATANPADKTVVPFVPVGYMAISPEGGRDGHAVALMRRGDKYYVISNKRVMDTNVVATKDDPKKQEALAALRDKGFEEAYYDPKPTAYKIYYADAEAGGAMPKALEKTEESTRRKDLEPRAPAP